MIANLIQGWTWRRLLTQVVPHIVAALFFAFLADAFYNKFDDGFKLRQSDTMNYIGMSKESNDYRMLYNQSTYWTGSMFSGMPTFQITGQAKNSIQLSRELIKPFSRMFSSSEELALWVGMMGAYLLALVFGVSPWLAMLAGVAFGLSSVNILYFGAGHRSKVRAISYMPGVLAGVVLGYRRNLWLGAVVSAFFLILHIGANHLQMTYYLIYVVGAFALTEMIVQIKSRDYMRALLPGVLLLVAGLGSAIPNAANLISTQEYAEFTTRGKGVLDINESEELKEIKNVAEASGLTKQKRSSGDGGGVEKIDTGVNRGAGLGRDYILQYSMSFGEWLAIMCPNLYGGETSLYWGDQYFSAGAFYFGVIIIALMLAYFVAGRDRFKWPMLALTLLAIVLSWRNMTPIMDFFIDYVPLFKKFRDTKMMLVMIQLFAGVAAVLAVKEMAQLGVEARAGKKSPEWKRSVYKWVGSLGGLLLLFIVFQTSPKLFFDFTPDIRDETPTQQRYAQAFVQQGAAKSMGEAMEYIQNVYWPQEITPQRIELFKEDVQRTILFIIATLIAALVLMMGWLRMEFVAIALVGLTTYDLWSVDRRYNNEERVGGQYVHWMKEERAKLPFVPTAPMMGILQAEEPRGNKVYEKQVGRLKNMHAFQYGGTVPREYEDLSDVTARFSAMRFHKHFRVLKWDLPYTDAETPYFVQAIGGYHGAKLQRYQDFMEIVLMDERFALADSLNKGAMQGGLARMMGHRMLNTKYILFDQLDQPVEVPNPSGPAWFVDEVEIASSNNDEMIKTRALRDFSKAVVHEEFADAVQGVGSPGRNRVELKVYRPERLTYEVNSEEGGLLVFSEVYYPKGWHLEIDGEEQDLLRANYLFRSAVIPAGKHEVEMYFAPSDGKGEVLANVGAIFMILFLIGGLYMGWRTRHDGASVEEAA